MFPYRNFENIAAVTEIPSTSENLTVTENVAGLNAYYFGRSSPGSEGAPEAQDITWTGWVMQFNDRTAHPVEARTGDMYYFPSALMFCEIYEGRLMTVISFVRLPYLEIQMWRPKPGYNVIHGCQLLVRWRPSVAIVYGLGQG